VSAPRAGVAFPKETAPAAERIEKICETVADAIVQWPALETAMRTSTGSSILPSGIVVVAPEATVSSSRAWIRFAPQPQVVDEPGVNFVVSLFGKAPRWFASTMAGIGSMHHRMSQEQPELAKSRSCDAFKRLAKAIDEDPLGCLFNVRFDAHRQLCEQKLKKEITRGEKFYAEMRQHVLSHAASAGEDASNPPPLGVQYARAVSTYAENLLTNSFTCERLFSTACADESGGTPERTALKKALKKRGVSVLRWSDERVPGVKPMVFPPSWRDPAVGGSVGPAVLLGFEKLV
jgi:hypothetical protein